LHNLLAALEGGDMQPFQPQKDYMLIFNMGDGRRILWKKTGYGTAGFLSF
jgi:hypothetical protein